MAHFLLTMSNTTANFLVLTYIASLAFVSFTTWIVANAKFKTHLLDVLKGFADTAMNKTEKARLLAYYSWF